MFTKMDSSMIISELMKYYGFATDVRFAEFLGIKPQTLSAWKTRNTLDYDLISTKCVEINMNWIFTGQGNMLKDQPLTKFNPKIYLGNNISTSKTNDSSPVYQNISTNSEVLLEKIKSLEKENQLLREMIEILKTK